MSDYTPPPPPPPAGPPVGGPPYGAPAAKDNSQLIGIIGAVVGFFCCPLIGVGLGVWAMLQAKKANGNPMWGYIAIGASVAGILVSIFVVQPMLRK